MNETKKCPQCQIDIPSKAKKCPHCQSDLRNFMNRHPIITILLVLFGLGVIVSAPSNSNKPTSEVVQVQTVSVAFDVPSLVGKSFAELTQTLGTSTNNSEPTQRMIDGGVDTWEKTWTKDGYSLMVTYEIKTKEIVDLFLGANSDAVFKQFEDTNNILKAGNLSTNDPRYTVEFVKAKNGPGYTGAIVRTK